MHFYVYFFLFTLSRLIFHTIRSHICVYTAVELNFYANKNPPRERGKNSINFHYRWHKKNYFIFYLFEAVSMYKKEHSKCFCIYTHVFASFNAYSIILFSSFNRFRFEFSHSGNFN